MRLIGHLADGAAARTFADYLYVQGIANQVEHEQKEGWGIWVNQEDQIERAAALLAAFRQHPDDPKYVTESRNADERRAAEHAGEEAYRRRVRDRRHLFRPLTPYGFGPLTFVLIAASVAVFAWSNFGNDQQPIVNLFITDISENGVYNTTLPEIRHGEIWRLFTPMFIHFSILHILFNLLWLRDLGSMIEGRQSSLHLLVLVLAIAAGSNLGQFYLGHSPNFGGMSGVVYGLLGYVWMRGKFDPGSGLFLHSSTVTMMIVWFFVCFTGVVGNVANAAHGVGLVMGMAWGFLSSLRHR